MLEFQTLTKFFEIILLFLICPQLGVYLGHLRGGSPIFDPKMQIWSYKLDMLEVY